MELSPERWKEVDELLDAALDLPPAERFPFLRRSCGDDEPLLSYVERLVRADSSSPSFLDSDAAAFAEDMLRDVHDLLESAAEERFVGAYRLVRRIGRGGMGDVYLAERSDGAFEQQVALKLLRREMGSDVSVQRFRSERQILASLSHPNIARVFDGGIAGDGTLYLVMEFVDGMPIDAYCDTQRLSIRERIRLWIQAAEAVQYANQNLVVHRDLKPSNILVGSDGRVKLLDFGIAKLLDPDRPDEHPHTRTGAHVMTPQFASPEQIRGEPVTTASDVYQLGLLLYGTLTGRPAYDVEADSIAAMARTILEEAPARPSSVVTRSDGSEGSASAPVLSGLRASTPERLARALRGDLDAIVLKALRKEPAERYASAGHLVDDLRRYLAGQSVSALTGSFRYRARTFLRRYRWPVAVAAMFAVLVIGYAVTVTLQAREIAGERDRARIEAEKAAQVTVFLTSLLEAEDPFQAQGDTVTLREVLARASVRIRDELADQPEVQAQLYYTTGRVYFNLSNLAAADSLLQAALVLRRSLFGDGPSSEVAEVQRELSRVRMALGDFPGAEALQREALAHQRRLFRDDHPDLASDLTDFGEVLRVQGRFDEAEPVYQEAIAMYRRLEETPGEGLAGALNNLGLLYHQMWRYVDAQPLYEEALALYQEALGERHPYALSTLHNLAGLARSIGDYTQAIELFRRVYALDRDVQGATHQYTMASLANLGLTLVYRGEYAEAEEALQRALDGLRAMLDADHPSIPLRLVHLSILRQDQGRFREAEALLREAHRLRLSRFGEGHSAEARSLQQLGEMYAAEGRHAEAESYFLRALAIRERLAEPPEAGIAEVLLELGQSVHAQGRTDEAEGHLRRALAMRRTLYGDDPNTAQALTHLASLERDRQRYEEAERLFAEADSIIGASLPAGNRYSVRLALERIRLHLQRNDATGAEAEALRVKDWVLEQYADSHPIRKELNGLMNPL